jgi:hypothetical protein
MKKFLWLRKFVANGGLLLAKKLSDNGGHRSMQRRAIEVSAFAENEPDSKENHERRFQILS